MTTPKLVSRSARQPASLYLDIWNLLLIALGISAVLILKSLWH